MTAPSSLGVDDAGYMPSELLGYGWSGKPLLAALRRDGPALATFRAGPCKPGTRCGSMDTGDMPAPDAADAMAEFLD